MRIDDRLRCGVQASSSRGKGGCTAEMPEITRQVG
jgi:hypothetical protein